MNALQKFFNFLSKVFDVTGKGVKDDDIKLILVGVSGIFALAVYMIKIYRNLQSVKRVFKLTKISK